MMMMMIVIFQIFATRSAGRSWGWVNWIDLSIQLVLMLSTPKGWKCLVWHANDSTSFPSCRCILLLNKSGYFAHWEHSVLSPNCSFRHFKRDRYGNFRFIVDRICYKNHDGLSCADLKVVTLLIGFETVYIKLTFFLCQWDSKSRSEYNVRYE